MSKKLSVSELTNAILILQEDFFFIKRRTTSEVHYSPAMVSIFRHPFFYFSDTVPILLLLFHITKITIKMF